MSDPDYSPDYRAPEDAGIIRRGVITDIQNEDRFSPVNTLAFSPLAQEYISLDNMIFVAVLLKMAQTPDGRKQLFKLAEKYISAVQAILTTVVETGKSHPITALNASTTFAVVAHRFGIITDSGYLKIADQTRSLMDKLIAMDWANIGLDGLTTLVEGGKVVSGYETGMAAAEAERMKALTKLTAVK